MNKAVFLDRDGVINEEIGDYITSIKYFTLLPHLVEALKELQERGYLLIVVTNQGGIPKGLYTEQDVQEMHGYMEAELLKSGVRFHAIYYCRHHPDYNGKCLCRKPGSLFVEKAIARFNIDPARSYFIGDKDRDIQAGAAAGVTGILVESNTLLRDVLSMIA